jgi:hypothetical protein
MVIDAGTKLIKNGMDKVKMMDIVAKNNFGNGNPSSIESIEACNQILAEFENIETTNLSENKGDKI